MSWRCLRICCDISEKSQRRLFCEDVLETMSLPLSWIGLQDVVETNLQVSNRSPQLLLWKQSLRRLQWWDRPLTICSLPMTTACFVFGLFHRDRYKRYWPTLTVQSHVRITALTAEAHVQCQSLVCITFHSELTYDSEVNVWWPDSSYLTCPEEIMSSKHPWSVEFWNSFISLLTVIRPCVLVHQPAHLQLHL